MPSVHFTPHLYSEVRRLDVSSALRDFSRASRRTFRTRTVLVIAQVALSTTLVVTAGLLVRTLDALNRVDAGFRLATRALTFRLALPAARYPHSADVNAFSRELETRLRALPGVQDVGAVSQLPLEQVNTASKYMAEAPTANLARARLADSRYVSPGLRAALGIQLVDGRWFTEDDDEDAALVSIVDERLATRAWPGRPAVGQRLHVPVLIDRQVRTAWTTVVGVVRHVRHRTLDAEVQEQVYLPYRQNLRDPIAYVVRTGSDPAALAAEVRDVVASLDGLLPAYDIQPLETYVIRAMSGRRFTAALISSFALLALALAAVGLAGLVSYSVASRRHEFGIRLAIGATPGKVRWKVLREALILVASGIALGVIGASAAASEMRSLLYGVGPLDIASYGSAIGLLCLTGLVASWLPASRATHVNPVEVLRSE